MYGENYKFLKIKKKSQKKLKQNNNNFGLEIIICLIIAISVIFLSSKIFRRDKVSKNTEKKIIRKKNDTTWLLYNATEIIDTYMKLVPSQYDKIRQNFINHIQDIASLKVYSEDDEKNLKLLKDKLSEKFKKNSSLVKNIFITKTGGLGNQLCALNNIIFYSEILGIKNIYLNDAFNNWYIKNKIITNKLNISLANKNQINCNSEDTFCGHIYFDFFFPVVFKPTARSIILKDEIKRNIPIINTNKHDLYIYIRTGDVFEKTGNSYSPSPYCFYQKILKQFSFENIYLVSMDDKSPIIAKLLSDYPKIIHQFHSLDYDFSTIMNAHNLVNCYSSFA